MLGSAKMLPPASLSFDVIDRCFVEAPSARPTKAPGLARSYASHGPLALTRVSQGSLSAWEWRSPDGKTRRACDAGTAIAEIERAVAMALCAGGRSFSQYFDHRRHLWVFSSGSTLVEHGDRTTALAMLALATRERWSG